MEVVDAAVVRLTRMEESMHVLGGSWSLLCAKHGWHKVGELGCELLFIHHIVAYDKAGIPLLALPYVVKNLGHVRLAHHLVACENQRHLKVRYALFGLIDYALDHR